VQDTWIVVYPNVPSPQAWIRGMMSGSIFRENKTKLVSSAIYPYLQVRESTKVK